MWLIYPLFDQTKCCAFSKTWRTFQTSALPFAVILLLCDSSTLLPIQGFQWISHLSSAHLCFKIQCHHQHKCTFTHWCSRDYCSWSIFSTCPQTAFLFSPVSPSALPGGKYENMIPIIKKSLIGAKYENNAPNITKKIFAWSQRPMWYIRFSLLVISQMKPAPSFPFMMILVMIIMLITVTIMTMMMTMLPDEPVPLRHHSVVVLHGLQLADKEVPGQHKLKFIGSL